MVSKSRGYVLPRYRKREKWVRKSFYDFCDELVYGCSPCYYSELYREGLEGESLKKIQSGRVTL